MSKETKNGRGLISALVNVVVLAAALFLIFGVVLRSDKDSNDVLELPVPAAVDNSSDTKVPKTLDLQGDDADTIINVDAETFDRVPSPDKDPAPPKEETKQAVKEESPPKELPKGKSPSSGENQIKGASADKEPAAAKPVKVTDSKGTNKPKENPKAAISSGAPDKPKAGPDPSPKSDKPKQAKPSNESGDAGTPSSAPPKPKPAPPKPTPNSGTSA